MNLIHEQVKHNQFGIGRVVSLSEQMIEVQFSDEYGLKLFEYPSAFGRHLVFSKAALQTKISNELGVIQQQIDTDKKNRDAEYQRCQDQKETDKLATKKTAAKKRALEKSSAKKAALI